MSESAITFCSDIARDHGVPLLGSATQGGLWFLVEYSGRVKDYLRGVRIPDARTRVQLIRQDGSNEREGLHFFVGRVDPQNPRLYAFHLQAYTDILDIDLDGLAAGEAEHSSAMRDEPLFLTCTNGKRDLCCARYGPEVGSPPISGGIIKRPIICSSPMGLTTGARLRQRFSI